MGERFGFGNKGFFRFPNFGSTRGAIRWEGRDFKEITESVCSKESRANILIPCQSRRPYLRKSGELTPVVIKSVKSTLQFLNDCRHQARAMFYSFNIILHMGWILSADDGSRYI